MRSVRRVVVFACIAASLSVWSIPVRAAENNSFGITPQPEVINGVSRQSFEIPLESGASFEDAVRVFNRTDQPLELLLYSADATSAADSKTSVGDPNDHPKGIASWITISTTKVSLGSTDTEMSLGSTDTKMSLGWMALWDIGGTDPEHSDPGGKLATRSDG